MCAVLCRIAHKRITHIMRNPFKYGCVVGGDSFCEKEMPELLDAYDLSAYKVKISRISEVASK